MCVDEMNKLITENICCDDTLLTTLTTKRAFYIEIKKQFTIKKTFFHAFALSVYLNNYINTKKHPTSTELVTKLVMWCFESQYFWRSDRWSVIFFKCYFSKQLFCSGWWIRSAFSWKMLIFPNAIAVLLLAASLVSAFQLWLTRFALAKNWTLLLEWSVCNESELFDRRFEFLNTAYVRV